MNVAVVVEHYHDEDKIKRSPWFRNQEFLAKNGVNIIRFNALKDVWQPFDAMMLHTWIDYLNPSRYNPSNAMKTMTLLATYRAEFPETKQIVLNNVASGHDVYSLPYWRKGDHVLYHTPPYDRSKLFPYREVHPYAYHWGGGGYLSGEGKIPAGTILRFSGPTGYRQQVAIETAKVGIGIINQIQIPFGQYCERLRECKIIVCPRGWGETTVRHWEAWLSMKPVLTDRDAGKVEIIPGVKLQEGVHYLVYNKPSEIPDIVSDWTKPSREDELKQIARNGYEAASGHNHAEWILKFFKNVNETQSPTTAGS